MEDYHNDNIDLLNFINKKKQDNVEPEPKRIFSYIQKV